MLGQLALDEIAEVPVHELEVALPEVLGLVKDRVGEQLFDEDGKRLAVLLLVMVLKIVREPEAIFERVVLETDSKLVHVEVHAVSQDDGFDLFEFRLDGGQIKFELLDQLGRFLGVPIFVELFVYQKYFVLSCLVGVFFCYQKLGGRDVILFN